MAGFISTPGGLLAGGGGGGTSVTAVSACLSFFSFLAELLQAMMHKARPAANKVLMVEICMVVWFITAGFMQVGISIPSAGTTAHFFI